MARQAPEGISGNTMRIAILADPLDNQRAGVHVFTREMIHSLLRRDTRNQYILVRRQRDDQFDRYANVEQCRLGGSALFSGIAALDLVVQAIRTFVLIPFALNFKRVDVVIEPAHFGPFNLLGRIRRVTVIHDLTPILFPELHRWHSQWLQNTFLRRILRRTNLIIANSDNTARDVIETYPEAAGKVQRIYPGRGEGFRFKSEPVVLKRHGIRKPYFLFTGTIEPRKNLLLLLEAYGLFREKIPDAIQLAIVGGKGWKSEDFFAALERHPHRTDIVQIGHVPTPDLPALYSSAIALIYPSLYEGFGLPILEAASCGTPVITARNSSLPEVAGRGGLFFETRDASDLAAKMVELYRDEPLRKQLGEAGLAHARQFDWDAFASRLLELLEEHPQ
jgi:glycosyltransferase involved in cell wall biosynthesis